MKTKEERQIILVKPSGVARGLILLIIQLCIRKGLRWTNYAKILMTENDVADVYPDEVGKEYFGKMIEHLTSGYSYVLEFEGNDAISIIKDGLIPRFPKGLRGIFAKNIVENIAHAPNQAEFPYQYGVFKKFFTKDDGRKSDLCNGKKFIFVCGLSESGKSTFCEGLSPRGIPRVKIRKIFELLWKEDGGIDSLDTFVKTHEEKDGIALWERFVGRLVRYSDELGVNSLVLDTLWGGPLGFFLKMFNGCVLVNIEASEENRVTHQMIRESILSREKAAEMLSSRDAKKLKSGLESVFQICDVVIRNDGTLEDFHNKIGSFKP